MASAVGLCLIAGVACGDDEPESNQQTTEPTSTAAEGSSDGQAGPEDGFQPFTSSQLGYSISYPDSWTVREANERAVVRADLFLAPGAETDARTNVNVLCEPVPSGTSTEDYLEANVATFEAQGIEVETVDEEVEVAEGTGTLIHWSQESLEISQVLAALDDCGWVLTLTSLEGQREEYEDEFLTMVQSFQPN